MEAKKLADLWLAGEHWRARDLAEQLTKQHPDNPIYRERWAQFEWGLGNLDAALAEYDLLLKRFSGHPGAIIGRASVLRHLRRWGEAREGLHLADKLGMRHPQLLSEWIAHGEEETLIASDLNAVKHQLNDRLAPDLGHDAARLLRMHGETGAAIQLLTRLLVTHKDSVQLLLELSRNYSDADQYENALVLFEQITSSVTDNQTLAQVFFEKASLLRQSGKLEEARDANEQVLKIAPTHVWAQKELASLAMESGQFEEAAHHLSNVLAFSPEFIEAWFAASQNAILSRRIGPWFDTMDQIERLSVGKTTRHALWNRVNRAAGLYLANHLNKSLAALNESRSILHRKDNASRYYKIYWLYIRRLIQWRAENQQVFGVGKEQGLLHVVGESHALSPNFGLVDWNGGRKLRCVSHWVPGCKQWHLANDIPNRYKSAVACILAQIPPGSNLMFCVGEIDARPDEGIWAAARKSGAIVGELVQRTVEGYLQFIANVLASRLPWSSITIQGIPAPGYPLEGVRDPGDTQGFLKMIREFNEKLMQGAHAYGWHFLDVYAATAAGNGSSNKQWHLDAFHLQPGFYGVAKQWLKGPPPNCAR